MKSAKNCTTITTMNGTEFIRIVKKLGKINKISVRFETKRGKGSHGTLYYGSLFTIVKDRKKEIGPGLLNKMLADLNLTKGHLK
ncbi:MAG: type II toxin-antitoxin system HicA family toxin [Desulfobacterales bacterium]|nr:type II toxin-antitoxin system HicA family toxin [Desulfobacterales bacterium]